MIEVHVCCVCAVSKWLKKMFPDLMWSTTDLSVSTTGSLCRLDLEVISSCGPTINRSRFFCMHFQVSNFVGFFFFFWIATQIT